MLHQTRPAPRRFLSRERRHASPLSPRCSNASPSSKSSDRSAGKRRSPTRKRTNYSSTLTKDQIKYQRFVNGLKRDVGSYLNTCLRENRFDTRLKDHYPMYHTRNACHTTHINARGSHGLRRDDPFSMIKANEKKRLTADVQVILTGPSLKTFYDQFIEKRPKQSRGSYPIAALEQSMLWPDDDER